MRTIIKYEYRLKRALDILIAVLGLAMSAPFLAIAAGLIVAESRGPIFFKQRRLGLNEEKFEIYKLRTMYVEQRATEQTFNSSPGVTHVGRVLRTTKLDEAPQLWNVLRGDMSIVGPRPCLPETISEMTPTDRQRFALRPGITGLAQVNGNVRLSWEQRWRYDLEYLETVSLIRDLQILMKTVTVVLRRLS